MRSQSPNVQYTYVAYSQNTAVFIKFYTQHSSVERWSREWEDLASTGAKNRAQPFLLLHVTVALNDIRMLSC